MAELDPVQIFVERLNASGVRYMITGSVATITYGEVRHTNDVDIVLALAPGNVKKLVAKFPIEEFYCPPLEVLIEEASRAERGHFNLLHHETGFRADCYIRSRDPLELWGFANRRCVELDGMPVWFAPPELVIIRKLEFFREGGSAITKHLNDIRSVLVCTDVDRAFIEEHVTRMGLQEPWLVCQPEAL
jgi:hypothetical protein